MPSPFPGTDPWLERPHLWGDVHASLIGEFQAQFNRHLRPRYVARVQERVYVESEDDPARKNYYPDVHVVRARGKLGGRAGRRPRGGAAVAEPVEVVFVEPLEVTERFIEIQSTDGREVVAVLEVLSPSNKLTAAGGRDSFLAKRAEVLASTAHWVEIDLLRAGVVPAYRDRLGPHEYVVAVCPADRRPKAQAWPIRLAERLPTISIPLRGADPPVPLDLQAALDAAYDRGAYDLSVDYRRPPVPPLPPELDAWADELLRAKGLR